jgi:uncharacterized membrane protein
MSRLAQDPGRESGPGPVIAWGNMAVLAAIVSAIALRVLLVPSARPEFLREHFARIPLVAALHIGGAAAALAIGPLQFSSRLRHSSPRRHRWMGRGYMLGVFLGGPAGFVLATRAQGGLPAQAGFALLATLWVAATAMAHARIRSGNVNAHRRWMTRSYAFTFAAVMLRLYMPLTQVAGLPFETAYPTIAWLCWVPNLVLVEWILMRRPARDATV